MDYIEWERATTRKQKSLIWVDLGYDAPSSKEEKNWVYRDYLSWIIYSRWAPRKHALWGIYEKKGESWEFERVMLISKSID